MDLTYLLGSTEGRIARKEFWIGVLLIAATGAVFGFAIQSAFGASSATGALLLLILHVGLIYPCYAVNAKRFHDRGRPGWLALLGLVPSALFSILNYAGISNAELDALLVVKIYNVAMAGIGLWFFVELGFLKGTPGPNAYGPDPRPELAAA